MEKIERTFNLFEELEKMITHKVNLENGPLTRDEIKIKVARKLYLTDLHIQHLLDKATKNDPR